jgi:hypothetical protein
VVSCSSLATCELIVNNCPTNKKIYFYHGKDEKIDDNGQYHRDNKWNDFVDNSIWTTCDLLIYTSTLTAGVDFNYDSFDKFYGVYS